MLGFLFVFRFLLESCGSEIWNLLSQHASFIWLWWYKMNLLLANMIDKQNKDSREPTRVFSNEGATESA